MKPVTISYDDIVSDLKSKRRLLLIEVERIDQIIKGLSGDETVREPKIITTVKERPGAGVRFIDIITGFLRENGTVMTSSELRVKFERARNRSFEPKNMSSKLSIEKNNKRLSQYKINGTFFWGVPEWSDDNGNVKPEYAPKK